MRIACSRCDTRYEVPEEKLEAGALKIRCSRCGHVFVVRRKKRRAPETAAEPAQEARFEDFDFSDFEPAPPAPGGSLAAAGPPTTGGDQEAPEDELPPLGELDLGDFENLDEGFEAGDETLAGEKLAPAVGEPLERVREEELVVPARSQGVPVQGLADDMPRLDIQRGPRRQEPGARSPVVPPDRRRPPLVWAVALAALGAAGYTGWNLYRHPEAFTFLRPSSLRTLWHTRTMEAQLGLEGLKGYYRDLPGDRRFFVIEGEVVNRSGSARSLIRVQGTLFGANGSALDRQAVYCGNVLTEHELASLPEETIEARLQNEVGRTLSNVDIAPGHRVPFMVVFPSPPEGVEKFNVTVTEARDGSGS
ncbi:MAG: hypothetical protein Kow0092_12140 [Deferrisomatales bacterium]